MRPISNHEIKTWELEVFLKYNAQIEVLDLSAILYPKNYTEIYSSDEKSVGKFQSKKILSFKQLENYINKNTKQAIFVDFINGLGDINLNSEKIFRIFKKQKSKYIIIANGEIPRFNSLKLYSQTSSYRKLISKIINVLISKIILFLMRHEFIYAKPSLIFTTKSDRLRDFVLERGLNKKSIVYINSHDFYKCKKNFFYQKDKIENICVFLDESATDHPDYKILNLQPPNQKVYFNKMNLFFDLIEKKTNLRVVIAAHPRSNYRNNNPFNLRNILYDKTPELVKKSRFVIAHMSTSVSFAVTMNKPIIFSEIPGLASNSKFNSYIKLFANLLGCKCLNLEKYENLSKNFFTFKPNKDKYRKFTNKYIRANHSNNDSFVNLVMGNCLPLIKSEIKLSANQ